MIPYLLKRDARMGMSKREKMSKGLESMKLYEEQLSPVQL